MNWYMQRPPAGDVEVRVVVEFTHHDLLNVKLYPRDLAQFREPSTSAADMLLDAELLARRIEEAQPGTAPEKE